MRPTQIEKFKAFVVTPPPGGVQFLYLPAWMPALLCLRFVSLTTAGDGRLATQPSAWQLFGAHPWLRCDSSWSAWWRSEFAQGR